MTWARTLLVVLLAATVILPFVVMFAVAEGKFLAAGVLLLWGMLAFTLWMVRAVLRRDRLPLPADEPRLLDPGEQPAEVLEVMQVSAATEQSGVQVYRGRLLRSASDVYDRLKQAFAGRVPLVQEDEAGAAIVLVPRRAEMASKPVRPWVHWGLFFLTLATTTFVGALYQGHNVFTEPGNLTAGLPYSLGLMAILGCHELGHYFVARRRGLRVTPPYFIPVPIGLGTFGAFIKMRSPAENRRALFDMAVAGPLAGLAIAIPALLIGLKSSEVVPAHAAGDLLLGPFAGESLLFALLSRISLGPGLAESQVILLSPLAFAGWIGLLVTALNLLPVGQLDGGHMVQAMFGRRVGSMVSRFAMWIVLGLAIFVWPWLRLFALLVFFMAGRSAVPLEDVTPLSPGRRRLGYVSFGILLSILPLPDTFWAAIGAVLP